MNRSQASTCSQLIQTATYFQGQYYSSGNKVFKGKGESVYTNRKGSTHWCRCDWVLRHESVGLLNKDKPVVDPPFDLRGAVGVGTGVSTGGKPPCFCPLNGPHKGLQGALPSLLGALPGCPNRNALPPHRLAVQFKREIKSYLELEVGNGFFALFFKRSDQSGFLGFGGAKSRAETTSSSSRLP